MDCTLGLCYCSELSMFCTNCGAEILGNGTGKLLFTVWHRLVEFSSLDNVNIRPTVFIITQLL